MWANRNVFQTVIGIVLFFISASQASAVVLDFEGLQDHESILNYYNGGTGGLGSSYGADLGVTFSANAEAIIDADAGGSGEFANEPSPDTVLHWHTGSNVVMNVLGGFDTGLSLFYSSGAAATVKIYDGLNATGNILASLDIIAQGNDGCVGDPNGTFCNWTAIGTSFIGIAYSVSFGGAEDLIGYDNVTIGSTSAVPVPGAFWLLGSGLLGLTGIIRRGKLLRRQ